MLQQEQKSCLLGRETNQERFVPREYASIYCVILYSVFSAVASGAAAASVSLGASADAPAWSCGSASEDVQRV